MAMDIDKIDLWGQDIPWLCALREKGQFIYKKQGLPTAKTEAWKYSYAVADEIEKYCIDIKPHHCEHDCHCHDTLEMPFAAGGVKFCNGKLATEHFELPKGVIIKPLVGAIFDDEAKKYLNKAFEAEKFPFAAINTALLEQGLMIVVEKAVKLEQPIFICYHNHNSEHVLCNVRNIIVVEKDAEAQIIESYEGDDDAEYFNNVVNEIYVQNTAQLHHFVLNKEAHNAYHIALNAVQVRQNGKYVAFVAQNRGAFNRHESYIELWQEGATAKVNGVYKSSYEEISDITTNIYHKAAHTNSSQLIRGVVDNMAKGVFQGKIHIAPNSQQCEGYQQHRALLLSNEAEVDAKPELEIFADDVKCSHGNTCGNLDSEQLFYMQTRGIDIETAKQILTKAHLEAAINTIDDEDIKNWFLSEF